jgi:hypothetical protein
MLPKRHWDMYIAHLGVYSTFPDQGGSIHPRCSGGFKLALTGRTPRRLLACEKLEITGAHAALLAKLRPAYPAVGRGAWLCRLEYHQTCLARESGSDRELLGQWGNGVHHPATVSREPWRVTPLQHSVLPFSARVCGPGAKLSLLLIRGATRPAPFL